MSWNCRGCANHRRAVNPPFETCRGARGRLCQRIDLSLLSRHPQQSLEFYEAASQRQANSFAAISTRLVAGAFAIPTTSGGFVDLLKQFHTQLFNDTEPGLAGKFRNDSVTFDAESDRHRGIGVDPLLIEPELNKLFQRTFTACMRSLDKRTFAAVAACIVERLFMIHPFHDGNGRIGRLLVNLLARECAGLHFTYQREGSNSRQRRKYILALRQAHRDVLENDRDDRRPKRNPRWLLERWLLTHLDDLPENLVEAEPPER